MYKKRQYILIGILVFINFSMSGCTIIPNSPDPLEKMNRGVFAFNEGVDKVVLKPVAKIYEAVTPQPINKGVTNFFNNISDIVGVANDLLQLKLEQAVLDLGRVFVNSTVGLFGIMDLATGLGLPRNQEDFGQTLGYWGIGSGPYLVLPLLGPTSLRDFAASSVDFFIDPRVYTHSTGLRDFFWSTSVVRVVDARADILSMEEVLEAAALDKYSYIRDAYLRYREHLVRDGQTPEKTDHEQELLDDLFDDLKEENDAPSEPEKTDHEQELLDELFDDLKEENNTPSKTE